MQGKLTKRQKLFNQDLKAHEVGRHVTRSFIGHEQGCEGTFSVQHTGSKQISWLTSSSATTTAITTTTTTFTFYESCWPSGNCMLQNCCFRRGSDRDNRYVTPSQHYLYLGFECHSCERRTRC